jgi:hypothetical protein
MFHLDCYHYYLRSKSQIPLICPVKGCGSSIESGVGVWIEDYDGTVGRDEVLGFLDKLKEAEEMTGGTVLDALADEEEKAEDDLLEAMAGWKVERWAGT